MKYRRSRTIALVCIGLLSCLQSREHMVQQPNYRKQHSSNGNARTCMYLVHRKPALASLKFTESWIYKDKVFLSKIQKSGRYFWKLFLLNFVSEWLMIIVLLTSTLNWYHNQPHVGPLVFCEESLLFPLGLWIC